MAQPRLDRDNLAPPFQLDELERALTQMKAGKARDKSGIVAEMLKVDCASLHAMLLDLFNDVLKSNKAPPADWSKSRLIVILKKGDAKLPSNYRPIAILPILYKLFSRMLCARIQPGLINEQSVDQAAHRQRFSTEDRLLSTALWIERCAEWNADLQPSLIDFGKAFDAIERGVMDCFGGSRHRCCIH